jgi:excisionase family DNA binding protein
MNKVNLCPKKRRLTHQLEAVTHLRQGGVIGYSGSTMAKLSRRTKPSLPNRKVAEQFGISLPEREEETLSPNQVGTILGITGEAVKQWIYTRRLPAVKLGNGYWKVKKEDLEQYISSKSKAPSRVVLFASPNKDNKELIDRAISSHGCNLVQAITFTEAVLKATAQYPTALIVDLDHTDFAWKLVEYIRKTKSLSRTSIALLCNAELSEQNLNKAISFQVYSVILSDWPEKKIEAELLASMSGVASTSRII